MIKVRECKNELFKNNQLEEELSRDRSKDEPCRVMLGKQEEECLEDGEMKKETNDECKLDAKFDSYSDESHLESVTEEEKDFVAKHF